MSPGGLLRDGFSGKPVVQSTGQRGAGFPAPSAGRISGSGHRCANIGLGPRAMFQPAPCLSLLPEAGPSDQRTGSMLEKTEIRQLQAFLRQAFGNDDIRVMLDPQNMDGAAVHLGERQIGTIELDDEDGDRSFSFAMKLPV